MTLSDFDFELPRELIAQHPPADRGDSRMLLVDRAAGRFEDRRFVDLPSFLGTGDVLTLNNSRVLPARLLGRRAGRAGSDERQPPSGKIEALLVKRLTEAPPEWLAMVKPGKRICEGDRLVFSGGFEAEVRGRSEDGLRTLRFQPVDDFEAALQQAGRMPLPPYIERDPDPRDSERYQTVYAKSPGSAAAPTAGLHFTPQMLDRVREAGARTAEITLHVGLGTFQPVREERIEQHSMHAESFEISAEAAHRLSEAKRVIAAGTTVVRTLEHAAQLGAARIEAGAGETDIFIRPGYRFQVVDALLTNFHLPRSTLLMLVCAFAGRELMLEAYRRAIREQYRFFSYGDCMLIV